MYRKHFGLTRHPFLKEIDPDDLFPSTTSRELEARLAHLLEMRGIGLITGDAGSGKTCACRKVVSALHTGLYKVVYVPFSTGSVMDLYKSIAWEFGLVAERTRAALFRQIRSEVSRFVSDARCRPVLIIDEAHNLRPEVLEDLRLLTNYQMDAENRLCLILLGHPEIRRRVGMSAYEALNQRIVMRYHQEGLRREELPLYLTHLLRLAGTELPLFEPAAIEAIFQATSGLPRKVNQLAHHILFAAAVNKAKTASIDHVQTALQETA
jgi:general secretion pathway protein A